MKYNSKKVCAILLIVCLVMAIAESTFAHSGRTDSSGGHKDNQNKSGLGSYHYHCGGNPPHLHDNGVCPYSSSSSNYSSSSSSSSKSSTSSTTSKSSSSNSSSSSSSKSNSSDSVTTSSSSVKTTTKEDTIIKASSIEINESITSMKVGETENLTVTISPADTTDKNIVWKSSNENIAMVSSTGKVVALKAGNASITATTSNGKTSTIEITIEEEVKEEKNDNNNVVIAPVGNKEVNNTTTNTTEESDPVAGMLGLGAIGGGCYWVYKKFKKSK